jgi:hypothetical protein
MVGFIKTLLRLGFSPKEDFYVDNNDNRVLFISLAEYKNDP